MSRSKQDDPPSKTNPDSFPNIQLHPGNIENPSLRWLILDGQRLALSHGHGESYSYRGIALAVQYLWNMGHRKLIVCVPEWMKTHEHLPYHEKLELKDHLTIFCMPSEAMEASYMEALARKMDALIVTQLGPDTWSEPVKEILQFTLFKDSFMLPEYPRGKDEPSLSSLLCLRNTRTFSEEVQDLMLKWERFSDILKKPLQLSLSEEPGSYRELVIIDGSNVAMSHGLDTFYSCLGIYLAVQYFWEKGYRKITACVPNWRYNSRNTVYGYEYLNMLYKKGLLALTGSISYDDKLMLKEAKEKNGLIVTNDKFRDLKEEKKECKDVIDKRIPFEFDGNHFSAAVGESTVRPLGMGEGSACMSNNGQTLHPDPPRPEGEDTTTMTTTNVLN